MAINEMKEKSGNSTFFSHGVTLKLGILGHYGNYGEVVMDVNARAVEAKWRIYGDTT